MTSMNEAAFVCWKHGRGVEASADGKCLFQEDWAKKPCGIDVTIHYEPRHDFSDARDRSKNTQNS